jgi:hypothetical protein
MWYGREEDILVQGLQVVLASDGQNVCDYLRTTLLQCIKVCDRNVHIDMMSGVLPLCCPRF